MLGELQHSQVHAQHSLGAWHNIYYTKHKGRELNREVG